MAFLQNEFSYVSSDIQLEKKTLDIPYKKVAFLQNVLSCVSPDLQLEKKTLNIPYKQMICLLNEVLGVF